MHNILIEVELFWLLYKGLLHGLVQILMLQLLLDWLLLLESLLEVVLWYLRNRRHLHLVVRLREVQLLL